MAALDAAATMISLKVQARAAFFPKDMLHVSISE
jgi:hypothetical protein